MTRPQVIIVGAGPSGLLLSLLLSQAQISVLVLESATDLDPQPRAAHYGPAAIPDLRRAGIIDEVRRRGILIDTMCWRQNAGTNFERIAGFDAGCLRETEMGDVRMASLVLQDLGRLMLERFMDHFGGEVRWRHRVVDVGQGEEGAWVDVEVEGDGGEGGGRTEKKRFEADYVVGCDGAGSKVRRSLFGDEYPGYTWDQQIVATNVYYDFPSHGFTHDASLVIDPESFYLVGKLTADGLYRVTYGEKSGLTMDEIRARLPAKYEAMLPGHPKPDQYKLVNISPYKMHQRCAPSFRVGRVMLAADAAHLCNPWGGMGITGGFVDVGGLADCLIGIYEGKADESILDLYSEKRIEKWKTIIDPISTENFKRVKDSDAATRLERDPFLQMLNRISGTKEEKEFLMGGMGLRYDFAQHYKTAKKVDDGTNGIKTNGNGRAAEIPPLAVN